MAYAQKEYEFDALKEKRRENDNCKHQNAEVKLKRQLLLTHDVKFSIHRNGRRCRRDEERECCRGSRIAKRTSLIESTGTATIKIIIPAVSESSAYRFITGESYYDAVLGARPCMDLINVYNLNEI